MMIFKTWDDFLLFLWPLLVIGASILLTIEGRKLTAMDQVVSQHAEVLLRKDLELMKARAALVGVDRARTLCADQLSDLSATILDCCYGVTNLKGDDDGQETTESDSR